MEDGSVERVLSRSLSVEDEEYVEVWKDGIVQWCGSVTVWKCDSVEV